MQLVYPLADAVQFSLFLCGGNTKSYFIKGTSKMSLYFDPDNTNGLPIAPAVMASSIKESESFIMVKAVGDVWFLLGYDHKLRELNFTLFDGSGLDKHTATGYQGKTYKAAFEMLMPRVRGMWMREEKSSTWSRLDEVASVGESPVGVPEETSRSNHRSVGS